MWVLCSPYKHPNQLPIELQAIQSQGFSYIGGWQWEYSFHLSFVKWAMASFYFINETSILSMYIYYIYIYYLIDGNQILFPKLLF